MKQGIGYEKEVIEPPNYGTAAFVKRDLRGNHFAN